MLHSSIPSQRKRGALTCAIGAMLALVVGCNSEFTEGGDSDDGPLGKADETGDLESTSLAGIYFNEFSGGFSGDEFFEVRAIDVDESGTMGRFSLRDIAGGGFFATIEASGRITLDGGFGVGAVESSERFIIEPILGGTRFVFDSVRVASTDAEFPLQLGGPPTVGDQNLAGERVATLVFIDPTTGEELSTSESTVTVRVVDTVVQLEFAGGAIVQGVFTEENAAAVRVSAGAVSADFASFAGSETNIGQDILGRIAFGESGTMTAILLLQTRDPLGSQTQQVIRIDAEAPTARL